MTHRFTSLAPALTGIECSWYFVDDGVDPSSAVDFWGACESVQRGVSSPHFVPGPFAPNEDAVHRWVTMVARAYQGIPPSSGAGHS